MNKVINEVMIDTIKRTIDAVQEEAQHEGEYRDEPTTKELAELCNDLQYAKEENIAALIQYNEGRELADPDYDSISDWGQRICTTPWSWEPVTCTEHDSELDPEDGCRRCTEETESDNRFNDPRYQEQFYK